MRKCNSNIIVLKPISSPALMAQGGGKPPQSCPSATPVHTPLTFPEPIARVVLRACSIEGQGTPNQPAVLLQSRKLESFGGLHCRRSTPRRGQPVRGATIRPL